ncbi:hypothetical protein ASF40_19225 [Microbacterium sp. Leaf288]|uniref:hypothetical protein n=1 Tax=Microbacterium TaxID=33882 RepID=UPI0006F4AA6B|nr:MULTISPECIES: hypothetical protein [Microbacterium]KQP68293.1 hypothetical protein ASF40_19225 [Microbacterium sp. Leaf288]MDR7113657.1 cytoskeletal protein RodZ [Microbacterium trichothecenolyticum]
MEPMPSSEPTAPAPLTRRTDPALADRSWMRSRRVQTFGLGALCGALGLSLLVVVTTILGASQNQAPLVPADPAPVSEPRPSASIPATPSPSSTPTTGPAEETDAATEPEAPAEQPVVAVPAPAPEPTQTQPPADESTDSPGNSDNAPGRQKKQP